MKLRYKLLAFVVMMSGLWLLVKTHPNGIINTAPPVLPPADKEQILINPVKHTITIVTAAGHKTLTLPDRLSTIDVLKNGNVSVTSPQFGLEHAPFVGATFADKLRFGAGLDGLYWKRLDLGLGAAGGSGASTVMFAVLSYNVWDNMRLGITYDHQQHVGVGITVRI